MQFLLMDTTLTRLVAVMIWSKIRQCLKGYHQSKFTNLPLLFKQFSMRHCGFKRVFK